MRSSIQRDPDTLEALEAAHFFTHMALSAVEVMSAQRRDPWRYILERLEWARDQMEQALAWLADLTAAEGGAGAEAAPEVEVGAGAEPAGGAAGGVGAGETGEGSVMDFSGEEPEGEGSVMDFSGEEPEEEGSVMDFSGEEPEEEGSVMDFSQ